MLYFHPLLSASQPLLLLTSFTYGISSSAVVVNLFCIGTHF